MIAKDHPSKNWVLGSKFSKKKSFAADRLSFIFLFFSRMTGNENIFRARLTTNFFFFGKKFNKLNKKIKKSFELMVIIFSILDWVSITQSKIEYFCRYTDIKKMLRKNPGPNLTAVYRTPVWIFRFKLGTYYITGNFVCEIHKNGRKLKITSLTLLYLEGGQNCPRQISFLIA